MKSHYFFITSSKLTTIWWGRGIWDRSEKSDWTMLFTERRWEWTFLSQYKGTAWYLPSPLEPERKSEDSVGNIHWPMRARCLATLTLFHNSTSLFWFCSDTWLSCSFRLSNPRLKSRVVEGTVILLIVELLGFFYIIIILVENSLYPST